MYLRCVVLLTVILLVICAAPPRCDAQTTASPATSPEPTPPATEPQEPFKVFTEEVLIPVSAYTDGGAHFHPTFGPDDIAVFEDDVPQQVKSVRRTASSVLLLLDTAGEMNPAMSVNTTREVATRLVSRLQDGDRVAALQFGGRVELFQDWTTETEKVLHALKTKLFSGKRARLAEALAAAAEQLGKVPAGSRHVVLITDGVGQTGDRASLVEAVERLLVSHATVHVVSYTQMGRQTAGRRNPAVKVTNNKRKSAIDIAAEIMNPSTQLEIERRRKIYVIIDTDVSMRRRRKSYEEATKQSEEWLASLAEETGGYMSLPASVEEMLKQAEEVAREIGAQYVVTYAPKRPLAEAAGGEYRNVRVASRRVGLRVRARRGYVVAPR